MSKIHDQAQNGDLQFVQRYHEDGHDINLSNSEGTILHMASYGGRLEVVDYLCSVGANVNLGNDNGYTPLMVSSRQGYRSVVQRLVDGGAEVNQADAEGFTALIFGAGYSMDADALSVLIEAGADLNLTTHTGGSALLWATWFNMLDNVSLLLSHGADKDTAFNGQKPIDIAREKGFAEIESLLA